MSRLFRITLDTNPEDCNLKCIMCEEHSEFSNFKKNLFDTSGVKYRRMPSEWIENIFEEANSLGVKEIIPSTMGEPLIYKYVDKFFELAEKYKVKINLTTNGTFPGKSTEEWARIIVPVTSDTKISINGATKQTSEKIMVGSDFDKQVNAIKEFIKVRDIHFKETGFHSSVTLQLTFMQSNMHELNDIINMAYDLGVDRVKGHHLWTHFKEIENLSFKYNSNSIANWNEIVKEANETIDSLNRIGEKKIKLEQVDFISPKKKEVIPYSYECPFLGKELWVSAVGKISPCCAPDEKRNSLGDFGNYNNKSLTEVLESEIYKDLVVNYKSKSLCKTCVMRKPL